MGFDGGSYSLTSRSTAAIAIVWAVIVGVAAGVLPASRRWRSALVPAGFLALFALWTAASSAWAASAEGAFAEFDRVTLYLAVFVLAAMAASRRSAVWIANGLALGITAVGLVALLARLFPGLVSQADLQTLLPVAFTRLSYPVNYWNGLGILLALAFPLLLRVAAVERHWLVRAVGVVPLPALAATIYLTSSRGAFLVAVVGVLGLLLLARERWAVVEAGLVAGVASLLAVLVLHARPSLVDPPLHRSPPSGPGQTAFVLIALLCLASGALYGARLRFLPPVRVAAGAGKIAAAVAVLVLVLAVLVSHPVRRFDSFKAPPVPPKPGQTGYVQSHLFSTNGSGRWQFYGAALHEFEKRPVGGKGAGSFEAWWAQHGSLAVFVRDAHSLYLETLGELGLVGFLLLTAALVFSVALGATGLMRAPPEDRTTMAALFAAAIAFLVALGIDWMWELPAVAIVGFTLLGLLAGLGGTEPSRAPSRSRGPRIAAAVAAGALGLALIVGQAIALLSENRLDASQAAVRRGDTAAALSAARSARDVEPWAASPYLQLGLIQEASGRLSSAEDRVRQAIHRNETDWSLWLTLARIQTKRGEIGAARKSLDRARELNPRSPIFTNP